MLDRTTGMKSILLCLMLVAAGCKKEHDSSTAEGGKSDGSPASSSRAAASSDLPRRIVGDWQIRVGEVIAQYHFDKDGAFTLSFIGSPGGKGNGTWKVDGQRLVMHDVSSNTGLIRAGEDETADIVSVNETKLVLKTTDIRGRPETDTFDRMASAAQASAANPKLIGSWHFDGPFSEMLILGADGTAVISNSGRAQTGRWWEQGDQLMLEFARPVFTPQPYPGYASSRPATTQPTPNALDAFEIVLLNDTTLTIRPLNADDAQTFVRMK